MMTSSRWSLLLCMVVLSAATACKSDSTASTAGPSTPTGGDSTFKPGAAILLSTGSPTKDEDPFVLQLRNGRMVVAWFSDRASGNADIYLTSTLDGVTWTPVVRATSGPNADFYPNLYEDDAGTVHLAWFQWVALNVGQIRYKSSPDGITWNPADETAVTTVLAVDDWVPSITQAPNGNLLVYFVSAKRKVFSATSDIYVSVKRAGSGSWDAAVPVAGINSATEHDHLPFAARTGDKVTLVWTRNDLSSDVPWVSSKAALYYATATDGLTFSAPVKITNDAGNVVNVFPSLFQDSAGAWQLLFLSTRNGTPATFSLPLANLGGFPNGLVTESALSSGYSPRIAATKSPGVYLGAWVSGPEGSQDVYYRFFRR